MKISRRKLKSLIESVLNEVENQSISYKSAAQEELEKELADLNEKALAAIPDDSTKRKVRDSIKKLMDKVDKAEFNNIKQIALNVYAGELGDVDTTLKGKLQVYDKNAVAILGKLKRLVSDEKKANDAKEVEDAKATSKPEPKPKKKGLSASAKDKVKKIQTIIDTDADGSWGPNTTTAWKEWIVSPETKKGIKAAGMNAVLTQQFLEDNKGKAAAIAKKAGKSANLDGVLELATTISDALIPLEGKVDDKDSITNNPIPKITLNMNTSDVAAEARKGLKNVASRQFNLEGTAGGGMPYNNIVVRADGEGIAFRQDSTTVSSIIILNDDLKLLEWAKWFNTRGYAFLKS